MTIRLRDPSNQEPVFFELSPLDLSIEIFSIYPINSKELKNLMSVSRYLCDTVYHIFKNNVLTILNQCANYDTPLNRLVLIISTQPNLSLNSIGDISHTQQSMIEQVKALGIPCPNKHLVLEDIPRLDQALEDLNLQKIWGPISQVLAAVEEKPAENASAQEIRLWMNKNKNHLQDITHLNLSEKALTTIPREITLLTGLKSLGLHNNHITVLPQNIFDALKQLQGLSLANNRITVLPQGIFDRLIQLQWLDLNNNQITSLPQSIFAGLIQLQTLGLHHNQITDLPQGIFAGLIQLQTLALNNNQITSLPQGIFAGLIQLQKLGLHYNQITDLPQGIFAGLIRLQKLSLHYNQIADLPQGIFAGLIRLNLLSLYNNQISALPQGIFNRLNQLHTLYLYGNPRLLFSYKDTETPVLAPPDPGLNNDLTTFKEFNTYVCRSSFAQFYQFVAQENPFDDVMRYFSYLSPYLQNVIRLKIQEEQNNSSSPDFRIALKNAVRWIFEMSPDQLKNVIYASVHLLAQESDGFLRCEKDPNWGEVHARDNILRLIDAMSLISNGLLG